MKERNVVFDDNRVCIKFRDREIGDMLDFLFADLSRDCAGELKETFIVEKDEETGNWQLTQSEKSLFNGANTAGLGVILLGEALFHLIKENDRGLAIHAGLVSDDKRTILIPGQSGSGKTSFTTWLLLSGMRYHTDELVMVNLEDHSLQAFTRPLNVKTGGVESIQGIFDLDSVRDRLQVSRGVTMIPHRLVNPDFRKSIPNLTHVIFPKYIAESKSEVIPLSRAEAGLELMRSNVIARNLPTHGFAQVTGLVRHLPAYRLHYQHFDDLHELMAQIS